MPTAQHVRRGGRSSWTASYQLTVRCNSKWMESLYGESPLPFAITDIPTASGGGHLSSAAWGALFLPLMNSIISFYMEVKPARLRSLNVPYKWRHTSPFKNIFFSIDQRVFIWPTTCLEPWVYSHKYHLLCCQCWQEGGSKCSCDIPCSEWNLLGD